MSGPVRHCHEARLAGAARHFRRPAPGKPIYWLGLHFRHVSRPFSYIHPAFSHRSSRLLDALATTYADAYGTVPDEDSTVKTEALRNRAARALEAPNYSLVTAQAEGQLIGFVFGYSLRAGTNWWQDLTPTPPAGFTNETGGRTVVLAEIEVRHAWQGQGVGPDSCHNVVLERGSGR